MVGRARLRFVAAVAAALSLALPPALGTAPMAQAAKSPEPTSAAATTTSEPKSQQVQITLNDIVREAERIATAEGRAVTADDIARALLESPSLGNKSWEQGVTFEVVTEFSGGFGQVSITMGPDGRLGIAISGGDS